MVDSDAGSHVVTGTGGHGISVLIENSEYWLRNNGDLAMLSITIDRLRARWPHARIAVLTDTPALLRAYFPKCEAVTVGDTDPWARPGVAERIAMRVGPKWVGPVAILGLTGRVWLPQKARGARRRLRAAWRSLAGDLELPPPPAPPPTVTRGSFEAVERASLLLCLGGGYLTDVDARQAVRVLRLLEHAVEANVPTALVGQGLGPIHRPDLVRLATDVLRKVDFIGVREPLRGPALLDEAGAAREKILITGDDATELAYHRRSDELGSDIGFCLRVAGYSPVSRLVLETVGHTLRRAADEFDAHIAPLIIAEYKSQDRKSTLPVVRHYKKVRRPPGRYVRPEVVADRVAKCRVMVTGAYHLAVFALSQGTPVVALTSSAYYDDKFLGLGEMFEGGLELLDLTAPDLADSLAAAIRSAWSKAPQVREHLRAQAREQIAESRKGFDRVFRLVERPDETGSLPAPSADLGMTVSASREEQGN